MENISTIALILITLLIAYAISGVVIKMAKQIIKIIVFLLVFYTLLNVFGLLN